MSHFIKLIKMRIKIFKRSVFLCLLSVLAVVIHSQITGPNSLAYRDVDHVQDKNMPDSVRGNQLVISGVNRLARGLKGNHAGDAESLKDPG